MARPPQDTRVLSDETAVSPLEDREEDIQLSSGKGAYDWEARQGPPLCCTTRGLWTAGLRVTYDTFRPLRPSIREPAPLRRNLRPFEKTKGLRLDSPGVLRPKGTKGRRFPVHPHARGKTGPDHLPQRNPLFRVFKGAHGCAV